MGAASSGFSSAGGVSGSGSGSFFSTAGGSAKETLLFLLPEDFALSAFSFRAAFLAFFLAFLDFLPEGLLVRSSSGVVSCLSVAFAGGSSAGLVSLGEAASSTGSLCFFFFLSLRFFFLGGVQAASGAGSGHSSSASGNPLFSDDDGPAGGPLSKYSSSAASGVSDGLFAIFYSLILI